MQTFAVLFTMCMCLCLQGIRCQQLSGRADDQCSRSCIEGETQECTYTFRVSEYLTMRPGLCDGCEVIDNSLGNIDPCRNAGCIPGGGRQRRVSAVNRQVPGPMIEVCEGDRVIVNVINGYASENVVIHWHGVHQFETPYMDGAPFLTQCPITPYSTFVYNFTADTPGTQMWHAHIGYEEADGVFGTMIIRRPDNKEPHRNLYDEDLAEHSMIVWHWFGRATSEVFTFTKYAGGRASGEGLIINGLGGLESFNSNDEDTYNLIPKERFTVESGKRYRFRVIYNTQIPCPVQLSVDNHQLLAIASDGKSFSPVAVDSIMLNGGERYDFVVNANQSSDNYWIRFRGMGSCFSTPIKVHQEAILHYSDADDSLPSQDPTYEDAIAGGILLNPIGAIGNENFPDNEMIYVSELQNVDTEHTQDIQGEPNKKIYITFEGSTYDSEDISGPYPQVNSRTFSYPPFPLLTQRNKITRDMYCTDEDEVTPGNFTACSYLHQIKLNDLVEIVFIDLGVRGGDHPFHMHGGMFHVVALNVVGENITTDYVKELNEANGIDKNFNGPLKDTVSVPSGGYAVVRFVATNPGFWFFHCHISSHADMGMGFVLQIGELYEMPVEPSNFPRCGNWIVQETYEEPDGANSITPISVTVMFLWFFYINNMNNII